MTAVLPPLPGPAGALPEWLVANDLGTFAMGTPSRRPERRYHGLLVVRRAGTTPPLHVVAEVNEVVRWPGATFELASFRYADGSVHPRGDRHLLDFVAEPAPCWRYRLGPAELERRVTLLPGRHAVRLEVSVRGAPPGAALWLSPYLTVRDVHALGRTSPVLHGQVTGEGPFRLAPWPDAPAIDLRCDRPARFEASGFWNEGVAYLEEARRGYPAVEDTFCPGALRVELTGDDRVVLEIEASAPHPPPATGRSRIPAAGAGLAARLDRAADAFVHRTVDGAPGIVAGYPWFGEWGRDSLIAFDGLLVGRGRRDEAAALLDRYAGLRVEGLVPNLVGADAGTSVSPSPDATLWYALAVARWGAAFDEGEADRRWGDVVADLLDALAGGRAAGIAVDPRGLLACDRRPEALTWMDARVDGVPVTPRAPYAVDVQALYHEAQHVLAASLARRGRARAAREARRRARALRAAFPERFHPPGLGHLADAHDGAAPDVRLRPNQLLAVALPHPLVPRRTARAVVASVRRHLLTPWGLRTLAPADPAYQGHCEGTARERDLAYHQGTVWPWWIAPWLDAVRAVDGPARAAGEARALLAGFAAHLDEAAVGQVSEIFDGDQPHTPRGAPAQAWSVAALLVAHRHAGAAAP